MIIRWLTVKTKKQHFTKPLHCRRLGSGQVLWNREKPQYTEEELERYEIRGATMTDKGWLQSEDGRLVIPEIAQWKCFPKALEVANHVHS